MILVDTSVWIEFLRASGSKYDLALDKMLENDEDICTTGMIIEEVLQGEPNEKEFNRLKKDFLTLPLYSPITPNTYVEAANIYRKCRSKGITIRKPIDCLIAAIAIDNDLLLFHNDRDFNQIAKVTKLQTLSF